MPLASPWAAGHRRRCHRLSSALPPCLWQPLGPVWPACLHGSPHSPGLALCLRNPGQPWLWGPQRPILLLNRWGTLGAVEERLELEDIKTLLVPVVVDAEPVAQVGAGPHGAGWAGQLQVDRIQPLLRHAGLFRQGREQLLYHGVGHALPGGSHARLGRLLAGRAAVGGRAQGLAALAAAPCARADGGARGAARREAGRGPGAAQAQRHLHREQLRGDVGPVHVDGGRGHHADGGLGDCAVCGDRAQRQLRARAGRGCRGVQRATASSRVTLSTQSHLTCTHRPPLIHIYKNISVYIYTE